MREYGHIPRADAYEKDASPRRVRLARVRLLAVRVIGAALHLTDRALARFLHVYDGTEHTP